jgi:Putative DNA-binding domain
MLGELQTLFKSALLQDDHGVTSAVLGDGLAPHARLAIYRHHVFTTLTEVLKAAYPVVCRLVDERFFTYAADQYIRQQPPTGPCLFEYGALFPHFLADFPPCRELVYLPDVARLEWAMHVAWHAAEATPVDPQRWRGLTPDELACLTLAFTPCVSYVSSRWPIERIWRVNQPDSEPTETVCLEGDGVRLEIRRIADAVTYRSLDAGTFAWRTALAGHQPLEEAVEAALAADPDFDLTAALQTLFAEGLVVE